MSSSSSLGPLAINASSPDPWRMPMAALEAMFYPDLAPTVPGALIALAVIYLVELVLTVAALWVRIRRGPLRLWRVQSGLLFPSTALLWLIIIGLALITLEAQTWLTWKMVVNHGSYHGIFVLRGFAWTFGHLFIYVQLLGLTLSTSFSARATKHGLVGTRWAPWFNAGSIALPVVVSIAIMAPSIVGEAACGAQWNAFHSTEAVGAAGEAAWQNGHQLDNDTVLAWYAGLERASSSSCASIENGTFGLFAFLCALELVGTVVCYFALSRKLCAQIDILEHSVQNYRQLEGSNALPQREGDTVPRAAGKSLDLTRTKSVPYACYEQSVEVVAGQKLGAESEREREMERHRQQERRAQGLRAGLNQLRWLSVLTFIAILGYLVYCIIVLQVGGKGQTDPYWWTVEEMLALWIFAIISGIGIAILLISGLDPERQSFLGFSLHSANQAAPDVESHMATLPDALPGTIPQLEKQSVHGYDPSVAGRSQDSQWQAFRSTTPMPPMAQAPKSQQQQRESQPGWASYAESISPV